MEREERVSERNITVLLSCLASVSQSALGQGGRKTREILRKGELALFTRVSRRESAEAGEGGRVTAPRMRIARASAHRSFQISRSASRRSKVSVATRDKERLSARSIWGIQ